MSLARIITRVQTDADELANDLRARGFEIEIVSPNNVPAHPVDLEVTLEECATEDALASAENAPQPQDVSVFIAPGALVETARSTIVVPLFSEPVVGPTIGELPPVAESVTVVSESDLLDEQVIARETVQFATSSTDESPIAEPAQPELDEEPPTVVLEGETVQRPYLETVPAGAAVPVGESLPRRLRIRIRHSDKVFWRVAIATAILGVGGLLTLSAHRQVPLPSALESAMPLEQQAPPFERAKVQDTSSTNQTATKLAPIAIAKPRPSPVPQAAEVRTTARAAQSVAFRPRRSKRNPESDLIAADTVVRYGKQAPVSTPPAPKKSGVKHYTDLK